MKIEKREIAVLIITLVILVTANAWWRVKETGRRARFAAQQEAAMREAGADAATPPDSGTPE
ncbi:MAG TPA: hypothetical protein VGH87_16630 [Polyangiaceae bacterium]